MGRHSEDRDAAKNRPQINSSGPEPRTGGPVGPVSFPERSCELTLPFEWEPVLGTWVRSYIRRSVVDVHLPEDPT